MWQLKSCLFCRRSRGGSAQKDGVPGVCVPRPLWIFQVAELSVPRHPHPTRKGLHLDPHRTHTSPHCQRVCQWRQLTWLWHGLMESVAFKQTRVHLCNIMRTKMVVNHSHHFRLKPGWNLIQRKQVLLHFKQVVYTAVTFEYYFCISNKQRSSFLPSFCLWLFKK